MATGRKGYATSISTDAGVAMTEKAFSNATAPDAMTNAANANDTSPAVVDQDAMAVVDLARAVLARKFRPRAGSVRRLAEAVIEAEAKTAAKAKKAKKSKPGKTDATKKKKKKKLAKIPGQNK